MKTIIAGRDEILIRAADSVAALLREKPDAVLALSANDDCLLLYREFARRSRDGELDLSKTRFFAVTEFEGLSGRDPLSCRARLRDALLREADPRSERSIFLSPELEPAYGQLIAEAGGLDLAILGVGERGRIGFNEPATPFDSVTHRQKLTKATQRELAALFGGEEQVPAYGYTMGIHTLLGAGEIIVISLGESRAEPVHRMLYARTDSFVPAAFLQLPSFVTVDLDEAAASKL